MSSEQVSAASSPDWEWDPSLYAGSARFYSLGRIAYPDELVERLADALELDGSGRILDVGCGPGSLTLPLAAYFAEAIGIDADGGMLTEARRLAADRGIGNATWRCMRAEELPGGLPPVRVATFAQSFHWMDRRHVAVAVRGMLIAGGALVHVHATTHQGLETEERLAHPQPPPRQITELVRRYLGPEPRAGQGVLRAGVVEREEVIYRSAGFTGPQRLEVPGRVVERTAEEVVASVYSLSSAAPHLFGDRLERFDLEVRQLLALASPDGRFSEHMRSIALDIWR